MELVGEVDDGGVEGASDDGEDHVDESKDRGESQKFHILNKIGWLILRIMR